jgi:hypothetical protein
MQFLSGVHFSLTVTTVNSIQTLKGTNRATENRTMMCTHIVAYASSVADTPDGTDLDLFEESAQALAKGVEICKENIMTPGTVRVLKESGRFPIVATGILFWMRVVMLKPNFFKEFSDGRIPPHFGLVDKIIASHVKLRGRALHGAPPSLAPPPSNHVKLRDWALHGALP